MTAETPLPTNRTTANTPAEHVADSNTVHDRSNTRIPAGNPTGVTIQIITPDPASGSGTARVVEFPNDCTAIAIQIAGDAFPRWILTSDTEDGLYLGDGTYNPITAGANIFRIGDAGIKLTAGTAHSGNSDIIMRPTGTGVVRAVVGKLVADAGIGVGNSAAATTPGTVVKKIEIFDSGGASLGFIPVYNAIT